MLGLSLWLNFVLPAAHSMFLYWPAILIGLTVLILFFPAPIIYHRSRQWWVYSNVRVRVTSNITSLNTAAVSSIACGTISCRIQRFLSWRYVLLANICHGSKNFRSRQSQRWAESLRTDRTSSSSSASMPRTGATQGNATRPTHDSSASSQPCLVFGVHSSV